MKKIQIEALGKLWNVHSSLDVPGTINRDILNFNSSEKVKLPDDISEYFICLNGSNSKYDNNFFRFYPLNELKKIRDLYQDWSGIPNYKAVTGTFSGAENCFIFADYNIHTLAYGICLYPEGSIANEIYVICGDKYKLLANSFSDFIDLYLNDYSSILF